nr:sensor histidine kinase [Methylobacterium sp. ZNC0032]
MLQEEIQRLRVDKGRLRRLLDAANAPAELRQSIALAVHELALNAIEHGLLGLDDGRLRVQWHFEDKLQHHVLVLEWQESGAESCLSSEAGFGTQTFTAMLFHEVGAQTLLFRHERGTSCTIRIPWNEGLGSVLDEQIVPLLR